MINKNILIEFIASKDEQYFTTFAKFIEKTVREQEQDLKDYFEREVKKLEPEMESDFEEWCQSLSEDNELFAIMLYKSFAITYFSHIEHTLNKICDNVFHKRDNLIFSYKDIKGYGLSRAVNYLERVVGKKLIMDEIEKEDFDALHEIRNFLVHSDGYIREDKRFIINNFSKRHTGLIEIYDLEHYNRVILTYDFIKFILEFYKKVINDLKTLS